MTESSGSPAVTDAEATARRAFFRAADLTLREGGYMHSELIARRAGADCAGANALKLMQAWSRSREYPMARMGWGRFGSIMMGVIGPALGLFGLAFAVAARRVEAEQKVVILVVAGVASVGLLFGAVKLWISTSALRRQLIDRANSFCFECQSAIDGATGRCPCGYLETAVAQPANAQAQASDTAAGTPSPLPGEASGGPVDTAGSVWEIETAAGVERIEGVAAIRQAVIDGAIVPTTKARAVVPADATDAAAEPPPWSEAHTLATSHFTLRVLFEPVRAHAARGAGIGAVIGVAWWLLNLVYAAFVVMGNPVIGGLTLLLVWGVANLALSPRIVFFSSRILWGAACLGAVVAFQNFGWQAFSKGVVPGLGMFGGAVVAGAVIGGLSGIAIGTVVGFLRRGKLERAPSAAPETWRVFATGFFLPIGVAALLVFAYIRWILPWLEHTMRSSA